MSSWHGCGRASAGLENSLRDNAVMMSFTMPQYSCSGRRTQP
jgi:hypothetical protein